MGMELTKDDKKYRALKARKSKVVAAHCRHCFDSRPKDISTRDWARLEGYIDLRTGALVVGCKRCNLHIVTAMLDSSIVKHLDGCGCERCGGH